MHTHISVSILYIHKHIYTQILKEEVKGTYSGKAPILVDWINRVHTLESLWQPLISHNLSQKTKEKVRLPAHFMRLMLSSQQNQSKIAQIKKNISQYLSKFRCKNPQQKFSKLNPVIYIYIHLDQMGFVPEMQN